MTITDHGFMGYIVLMNKEKFDAMPTDLQEIVVEVSKEVMHWEWEESKKTDASYLQEIIDSGMEISEFSDEEKAKFVEVTKPAFDEFRATENGQEILDLINSYKTK